MDIIDYLASDNYIIVNKSLIKTFGLEEAVLFGELCREYRYWKRENKLKDDDMFYSTIDNIEENTGLTAHEQRQAIKSLENAEVLSTELKGIPAKKYFRINIPTVVKILTSCSADFSLQDVKNIHSNNNKNNIENNNKISLSKDKDISAKQTDIDTQSKTETTKPKQKKESLWDKCISLIQDFTDDEILRDFLTASLKMFLENARESNTPFFSNTFKGKLNALQKLSEDNYEQRKIVRQTLDKGWSNFYEIKQNTGRQKVKDFARDVEHMNSRTERANKEDMTIYETY